MVFLKSGILLLNYKRQPLGLSNGLNGQKHERNNKTQRWV